MSQVPKPLYDVPIFNPANYGVETATTTSEINVLPKTNDGITFYQSDGTLKTDSNFVYTSSNVGIGINTPTASLHINNTSANKCVLIEDSTSPDSSPFVIDNAGNIGIGTLTPLSNSKLHIKSETGVFRPTIEGVAIAPKIDFLRSQGTIATPTNVINSNSLLLLSAYGLNTSQVLGASINMAVDTTPSASDMPTKIAFSTCPASGTNTERMVINSSGNVGIGTNAPTSLLHISQIATTGGVISSNNTAIVAPSFDLTGNSMTISANMLTMNHAIPLTFGYNTSPRWTANRNTAQTSASFNSDIASLHASHNNMKHLSTGILTQGVGSLISSTNESTGTITTNYGSYNIASNTSTGSVGTNIGQLISCTNAAGGTITSNQGLAITSLNIGVGTVTTNTGIFNTVSNSSTGNMTTQTGINSLASNASTATITLNIGASISTSNAAGGTVATNSCLKLTSTNNGTITTNRLLELISSGNNATNNHVIYSANNVNSYHQGSLGLGVALPTAKLHVNNITASNSLLIEDDTTPDSSPFVIDSTGNVGIGLTTPDASAILDITSTTKGMLPPRLATAPSFPATGLIYYDTALNALRYFNGSIWITSRNVMTQFHYLINTIGNTTLTTALSYYRLSTPGSLTTTGDSAYFDSNGTNYINWKYAGVNPGSKYAKFTVNLSFSLNAVSQAIRWDIVKNATFSGNSVSASGIMLPESAVIVTSMPTVTQKTNISLQCLDSCATNDVYTLICYNDTSSGAVLTIHNINVICELNL